jgi:hypothetical protein
MFKGEVNIQGIGEIEREESIQRREEIIGGESVQRVGFVCSSDI